MQPAVAHPIVAPSPADAVVLAVVATDQERLRSGLRRAAASPELLAALTRVVVLDAGRTPSATVLREAVRLPAGLLRVVRQPDGAAAAVARALAEATAEPGAGAVIVLGDAALADPGVLAAAVARRSPGSEVVGLRDAAARERGPAGWWGAVLPLDAVRAVGATLPEAGAVALADLVLRAEAAGFRSTVLPAAGPVPQVAEADRLRLALLHAPTAARTRLLVDGLAGDARLALALRFRELAHRREALRTLGAGSRAVLWARWPALRRRARDGVLDRASMDEWTLRFPTARMDPRLPLAERETSAERPAAVRLRAWPTTKRRTSAA